MKKIALLGILLVAFLFPVMTVKAETALTSLTVKGIKKDGQIVELTEKKKWKLTYVSPQSYMIVVAEVADPSYVVEGAGKVELEDGENTHIVTVKNAEGTVIDEYTLVVTKSTSSTVADKDNPETGMFISISVIVAGLGLASVAYIKASRNKKFNRI